MPKRKADTASDDEQQADEAWSDSEVERPLKHARVPKARQSKKVPRDSADEEEEEQPKKAKPKAPKKPTEKSKTGASSNTADTKDLGTSVLVNGDGDRFIDLGKKRRATVRTFKGTIFLDIREYYGQEGDEQPGKKGVTLQQEQWESLKNNGDSIDALFARANK
ncbi:transcriptional Coactivator p15-domain-containing protein [Sparassis latifolia]